jgi:hypothetical protein
MVKIYDAGLKFRREEAAHLRDNYLLDLKSKDALNPDARIPFIALKNLFLRPNIDEGDPYDDVTQDADLDKLRYFYFYYFMKKKSFLCTNFVLLPKVFLMI